MKETRLYFVIAIMLLAIFMCVTVFDSVAQQRYVDDFYREAYINGVTVDQHEFEFSIVPLQEHEGRSIRRSDHWFIEIDSYFWGSYGGKTQGRRLVFHELGHILLGLPDESSGNTIMNPAQLYKPLTEALIVQMLQKQKGKPPLN